MLDTVSERIKWCREKKDWTQPMLAEKAKVALSSVSAWENGREPKGRSGHKLANALGVSLEWLRTGDGPRSAPEAIPKHSRPMGDYATDEGMVDWKLVVQAVDEVNAYIEMAMEAGGDTDELEEKKPKAVGAVYQFLKENGSPSLRDLNLLFRIL